MYHSIIDVKQIGLNKRNYRTARLNRSRPWRSTGNLAVVPVTKGASKRTKSSKNKEVKKVENTFKDKFVLYNSLLLKEENGDEVKETLDVKENGVLVESQGHSKQSSKAGSTVGSKPGSAAPSRPESKSGTKTPTSRPISGTADPSRPASQPLSRKSTGLVREVVKLDEDSAEIQLGSHDVVVRIPKAYRETWNPNERADLPEGEGLFDMEWVYGFMGKETSSNIELLSTGEWAYFVASVVILYNPDSHTQRHYRGHTNDISCLRAHNESRPLCASGQSTGMSDTGGPAHVQIWNYDSLETLYTIGTDVFEVGISTLVFLQNKLAVVDQAQKPNLTLWTIDVDEAPTMLATEVAASNKVLSMCDLRNGTSDFVTTGHGNVSVWTVNESNELVREKGLFTRKIARPQEVTCSTIAKSGEVLTGDSDGNVMIWNRVKVVRVLKGAHQGAVGDICVMPDGSFVSGGLQDAALVFFNEQYQLIGAGASLPTGMGNIKVIKSKRFALDEDNGSRVFHLIIGTTSNCILEASMKIEKDSTKIFDLEFETVVQGHAAEVMDVARVTDSDGNPGQFLTSCKNGLVIRWDGIAHKPMWTATVDPEGVSTIDMDKSGETFAAGSLSGKVYVSPVDTPNPSPCLDVDDPIDVVKFSPDGTMIAIAAHDNGIHVVERFEGDFRLAFYVTGHSSHVNHIDWTTDSKFLRSNSADHELLFWSVETQDQVVDVDEIDNLIDWASHNCTITFETLGIWTRVSDGTDVNVCDVDTEAAIVASGDDSGRVNIMRYPAISSRSNVRILQAHSAHITGVQFIGGSNWLISTGGREASVVQWSKKSA